MFIVIYVTLLCRSVGVHGYSNKLFTITKQSVTRDDICFYKEKNVKLNEADIYDRPDNVTSSWNMNFMIDAKGEQEDPLETFHHVLYKFLFGKNYGVTIDVKNNNRIESKTRNLLHYPTGRVLRKAELFKHKSGVHVPMAELILPGHCVLNVTKDYMQTAVDAFTIFVKGDFADIQRLPVDYLLNSARTISMMKISHEKLAATWNVIKGSKDPIEVTYESLEMYRPLFKYLNGKEMAKLNLSDHRILNFIGTHPELNRHQVGLVASKYIKTNLKWSEPKYLNLMNNLLCGVPITHMREVLENTFLQLSYQVFYHTRACDPLQRRFYLAMMTRTQALGKSYSWNAQDVSRLGLLLAEVEGEDLSAIKPEALTGLTAQVVMAMRPENLKHLSDVQLRFIGEKPFNILSKKLKKYRDKFSSAAVKHVPLINIVLSNIVIKFCTK